ncbi:MAG: hypothetical protein PHI76_03425 [Clostridia bacterium]|nr:hypothetical protein [Clostridia bacterium]
MNLDRHFIEVFDVFTNDYKIVERSTNNRGFRNSFLLNESNFTNRNRVPLHNLSDDFFTEDNYLTDENFQIHFEESKQNEESYDSKKDCEDTQNDVEDKKKENLKKQRNDIIQREAQPKSKTQREQTTQTDFDSTQPFPIQPSLQRPIPEQPFAPTGSMPQPPAMPQPPVMPQPQRPPQQIPTMPGRPVFPPRQQPFPPFQPRPIVPPASNRAFLLLTELYYELGNLQSLYMQIATYAPDVNASSQLNAYANEVFILNQAVFEIYRTLTGRILPPTSNRYPTPILTGDYCTDLGIAYNLASSISTIILQLIRIIDVNNINRQLVIISATINNQMSGINNLMSVCL